MRKAFGEKIRTLRKERSLSGQQLGKSLGISQAAVSKIENGAIKPSLELAEQISKALKLTKKQRGDLEFMVRSYLYDFDRWSFEESDQYYTYQNRIAEAESKSTEYLSFVWNVIPGLLQSEVYMREMHKALNLEQKRLDAILELRKERQEILLDDKRKFKYVIFEQALYTLVTKKQEHAKELHRLAKLLETLEKHAELRVLERDVQLTLIPNVNFIILDHKLVLVDEQYWTQTVWHQGQVEAFSELFSDLWQKASSKRRALTLIQKARKHFLS